MASEMIITELTLAIVRAEMATWSLENIMSTFQMVESKKLAIMLTKQDIIQQLHTLIREVMLGRQSMTKDEPLVMFDSHIMVQNFQDII